MKGVCKMQVSAINSQNSGSFQNFKGRRDNVDAFINLDDGTIRQLAYLKTNSSIDTGKHKKIDRAFDYALPLAGGLALAAGTAKGGRLGAFAKGAAGWGLFLAGTNAVMGIEKEMRKRVNGFRELTDKHPFLTFITSFALAFGAGAFVLRKGFAGFDKIAKTNLYQKFAKKAAGYAVALKTNKKVASALNIYESAIAKIPSALKSAAKTAASWSPLAIILASFGHSSNHSSVVNRELNNNYNSLKAKQLDLARRRNLELSLENDFMLTNAKKSDDVA